LIAKAAPGRQRGVVSIALAAAIPLIGVRLLGDVIRFRFRIRDAISIAVAPAAAGDFLRLAVPLQLRRLATGAESQVSGSGRFFLFFSPGSLRRLLNVSRGVCCSLSILANVNYLWTFPIPLGGHKYICIYIYCKYFCINKKSIKKLRELSTTKQTETYKLQIANCNWLE